MDRKVSFAATVLRKSESFTPDSNKLNSHIELRLGGYSVEYADGLAAGGSGGENGLGKAVILLETTGLLQFGAGERLQITVERMPVPESPPASLKPTAKKKR